MIPTPTTKERQKKPTKAQLTEECLYLAQIVQCLVDTIDDMPCDPEAMFGKRQWREFQKVVAGYFPESEPPPSMSQKTIQINSAFTKKGRFSVLKGEKIVYSSPNKSSCEEVAAWFQGFHPSFIDNGLFQVRSNH